MKSAQLAHWHEVHEPHEHELEELYLGPKKIAQLAAARRAAHEEEPVRRSNRASANTHGG